ncbi:MAG: tyrosine-type recombinase/integrase [Chloroflexi bacterium]|nr:tyrosine-type recombinase/integrase [Chloroflexota bacterium]
MRDWDEALWAFDNYLREAGFSRSTRAGYVGDVRGFAQWLHRRPGILPTPADFSSADLEAHKQHLAHELRRPPATVNRNLQSLRKFSRFLKEAGLRSGDPTSGVPLAQRPVAAAPHPLSDDEVAGLLKAAARRCSPTARRDQAIIHLLLHTGLRAGELTRLRLADLQMGPQGVGLAVRGANPRTVPLPAAAYEALAAYLGQRPPAAAEGLLLGRDGKPLAERSLQRVVADVGQAAGLDLCPRRLRATFAQRLWQSSGDVALLAHRLGHRRLEPVLRYICCPAPCTTGAFPEPGGGR